MLAPAHKLDLSKSFDLLRYLSRIHALIYELRPSGFFQKFSQFLPYLLQSAAKTVGKGGHGEQSANIPGKLCALPHLLRVSDNLHHGGVLVESIYLGRKVCGLLPDIFELLWAFA